MASSKGNSLDDKLVKMIKDYAVSICQEEKPERQALYWFILLNNLHRDVQEIYEICSQPQNRFFCQQMIEALDSMKANFKTLMDSSSFEQGTNEKKQVLSNKTECENSLYKNSNFGGKTTLQLNFKFGDVDFVTIIDELKNKTDSCVVQDKDLDCKVDANIQTDLSGENLKIENKVEATSTGVQVSTKSRGLSHDNLCLNNRDELRYNLPEPLYMHHVYDEQSYNPSMPFYNDSSIFCRDSDNYPELNSLHNLQYQPLSCSNVVPGRNVSAPVFIPRIFSNANVSPHSIMFPSNNSPMMPGLFSPPNVPITYSNPHTCPLHRETRRSYRKSDVPSLKKARSSNMKTVIDANKCSKHSQFNGPMISFSHALSNSSSDCFENSLSTGYAPQSYLCKLDELEKSCNLVNTVFIVNTNCEDPGLDNELNKRTLVTSDTPHSKNSNLSCFSSLIENETLFSSCNASEDVISTKIRVSEEIDVKHKKRNDLNEVISLTDGPLHPKNRNISGFYHVAKSRASSSHNEEKFKEHHPIALACDSDDMNISCHNHLDEAYSSNRCENNDLKGKSSKMSFVNVLTGSTRSVDSQMNFQINRVSNEMSQNKNNAPPNLFELSHFPVLKPSYHLNSSSNSVVQSHQPSLSTVFEVVENNEVSRRSSSWCRSPPSPPTAAVEFEKSQPFQKNEDNILSKKDSHPVNKRFNPKKKGCYPDVRKTYVSREFRATNTKLPKADNQSYPNMAKGNFVNGKSRNYTFFRPKKVTTKRKTVTDEDGWTLVPSRLRHENKWESQKNSTDDKLLLDISSKMPENVIDGDNVVNDEVLPLDISVSTGDSSKVSALDSNFYTMERPFFSMAVGVVNEPLTYLKAIDKEHLLIESNFSIKSQIKDDILNDFISSYSVTAHSNTLLDLSNKSSLDSIIGESSSDQLTINCFSANIKDGGFPVQIKNEKKPNIDSNVKLSVYDNKVFSNDILNPNFVDNLRQCSSTEESEIAGLILNSISSWTDKSSDVDSDEQHLNDEDARKSRELEEEAIMLTRKIKDLESNENEIDTETELESDHQDNIDPHEIFTEYSQYLSQIPWGDQMDELEKFQEMLSSDPNDSIFDFQHGSIEQFQELVARHPVKALDLHCKLLGRSKRYNTDEQSEVRRKKAEEKREKLLKRKAAKMRELLQRVEEVRQAQLQIIEERKCRIDLKLKKAEENRNLHLKTIKRKAHDEEEKLKEIAFINNLEAQNRRHDSLALRQEQEERLQNIIEERQRKVDEKAAKEAAVGERKRVLEAERQEKIEKIQEKRRQKEEIIGKKQQEKKKERQVIALEKAREREERLLARQAAQLANAEELQKKIRKKQENSARRHEENIQQIRQKALEVGMFRSSAVDDNGSDSHIKNGSMDRKKTSYPVEEQEEHSKPQRKRYKKLRNRLIKQGEDNMESLLSTCKYVPECDVVSKMNKCLSHINEIVGVHEDYFTDESIYYLEISITELSELVSNVPECSSYFMYLRGLCIYEKMIHKLINIDRLSSLYRTVTKLFMFFMSLFDKDFESCKWFLVSNIICEVLDGLNLLLTDLLYSKMKPNSHVIDVTGQLLLVLEKVLYVTLNKDDPRSSNCDNMISSRARSLSGFFLCSGFMKKIYDIMRLASRQDPEHGFLFDSLIQPAMCFLTQLLHPDVFSGEMKEFFESTDLLGVVSLLYGHFLHESQRMPSFALSIILFFRAMGTHQLPLFQKVIGAEGISLQFRYVASYILNFCSNSNEKQLLEVLHYTILVVGYFSLKNANNQLILQSGKMPTVLQQLLSLPFQYFCEPYLQKILFPTLIAICHDNPTNRELLENEMSYEHIVYFLENLEFTGDDLLYSLVMSHDEISSL